jgi:hypothetical protein
MYSYAYGSGSAATIYQLKAASALTCTTRYGLHIAAATNATNDWGVYCAAAKNYFGGNIYLRADSKPLYLGAGDDASLQYDGTDLLLNCRAVGTGSLKLTGHAWPAAANTYDLGSATLEWGDLYLAGVVKFGTAQDCGVAREAASAVALTDGSTGGAALALRNMAAPGAHGTAGGVNLYATSGVVYSHPNGGDASALLRADAIGDTVQAQNDDLDDIAALTPSDGDVLTYDTDHWTSAAPTAGLEALDTQTYTDATGSWSKPAVSGTWVLVECWGGGGSGGCSDVLCAAGGGGGGGYRWRILPFAMLPSSVAYDAGAGGDARSTEGNGYPGGISYFGDYCEAYGGGGGDGGSSSCGGGGGGAGFAAVGITATSSTGGAAGDAYGGAGGNLGAAGSAASEGPDADGTGGGGGSGGWIVAQAGGASTSGGGGGGGYYDDGVNPAVVGTGGTSTYGGAGGNALVAGSTPGGGGGASDVTAGSTGAGGAGRVKVTVY